MEIKVNGQDITLPRDLRQGSQQDLEEFWHGLEKKILCSGRVIEAVVIDGIPVYDNHLEAIASTWPAIEKLEVITVPCAEACRRLAGSLRSYLSGLLPHLEDLANEFYLGAGQQTWKRFEQLLENLQWVVQGLQVLAKSLPKPLPCALESCSQAFYQVTEELWKAVERKDGFAIGDILRQELAEQLELLEAALGELEESGSW
ncbi:hypothetical protein [Desulfovirgula thermocuniculi]|uniref:hypothetical protein n=1 Tax=Desulfovirgula thermocuniculi TaxID=348842 RepID=UPI00042168CC|nr:hypothetical protein [Desulfovirgula thermocuniculi]